MYRGLAAGLICGAVFGVCVRTIIELVKLYKQPEQEDDKENVEDER